MSISSRQRPPSLPSLHHTTSLRSTATRRPPPPVSTVITSPPWARDEPPSPKDQVSIVDSHHATESRPSDVASYNTSVSNLNSRWWTFTLPRPTRDQPTPDPVSPNTSRPERSIFKDISMSWLPTSSSIREGSSFTRRDREKDPERVQAGSGIGRDWGLSITLPTPAAVPFTLSHNNSPGWDSPWTPRVAAQGPSQPHIRENSYGLNETLADMDEGQKSSKAWRRRKKKFRAFILTNTYVPLLFRFINITFTGAALGMAIRIRKLEVEGNVMGAVGSSPTVVIIFAPLTLVHVMVAIYLEYFGRPLGLWRTSGKLAHTLSEVLFICAWSAALSLSFDNFFTSLVPCASPSSMSWYNQLPRPPSEAPNFEGGLGDRICDDQLALICLVGVGLLVYCTNLIISLFRIFEKVKYHPAAPLRTS
ncbi:hypothetical protein BDZ94DRAFT_1265111 [Collybia nuda]|uniref:Uncharacterized protein n=1 Tax=Collybia nuda TaxID=64659 RepID=A0A9P5Y3G2_9AGAR|nr:hypothetical protein BDZ94DRAFT_1265111 [Collybia nuda]